MTLLAQPKPVPRRTMKARKHRAEHVRMAVVLALVVARDGYCRLQGKGLGACRGASEFAHLEDCRRARTMGMAPETRHRTDRAMMLCTFHHQRYDARTLGLAFRSERGADGPVQWYAESFVYTEEDR